MTPRTFWLLSLLVVLAWTPCMIFRGSISPLAGSGGGMGGVPPMVALLWL
mgnify:CR=1 FL=1